jgi:hypothetical protein
MNLKYFSPSHVFAINENLTYTTYTVGEEDTKVLVLENFYKYPKLVRQLFLKTPVPMWKYRKGSGNLKDYYDCRHSFTMNFGYDHVHKFIAHLVKKEFKFDIYFRPEATTNVFQLVKSPPKGFSAFPHSDIIEPGRNVQPVNALVYLNTPQECHGGTALFRHRASGRETMPKSRNGFNNFEKKYFSDPGMREDGRTYWCDIEKYWEKFHLIEMKFNRMTIFPSEVFHGAWHEPTWFKKHPRINQVFFSQVK